MERCKNGIYLWFVITILNLILFIGCSSFGPTKPNSPFSGPYPSTFNDLAIKNPLLAEELGKLPGIQYGISDNDVLVLKEIVKVYKTNPKAFDKAFEKMYQVGLPEVRKYCTPLQALYWLAEDGKIEELHTQIHNYSLRNLLDSSWNFNFRFKLEALDISEQEAKEIIDVISKDVIWYAKYQKTAKDVLKVCYSRNPNDIPREYRKIIENDNSYKIAKVKFDRNKLRWKDFNIVVDRLNAPELLHYYINRNITYKKNRTNSHTPKHTFSHNWGDCDDLAVFGKYILRKGGYKAIPRYVHWTADNRGHVGVVIKLEDGRYFLAVDFGGTNTMTGPYTNISEVDEKLSGGHNYHDSGWWQQPR